MADVEELIGVVTDTSASSFRRRMAVTDLARTKEPRAVDALAGLLHDDDAYLRREVVTGLARIEDSTVIAPLIQALDIDDDYIQRDAAEALGRVGDGRAIEPLQVLLEDNAYSVRDAAARALERIERRAPPPPPEPTAAPPETAAEEPAPVADTRPPSVAAAEPPGHVETQVSRDADQAEVPIRFDAASHDSAGGGDAGQAADAVTAVAEPSTASPPAPSPAYATPPPKPIVTAELLPPRPLAEPTETRREVSAAVRVAPVVATCDWDGARRFRILFGDADADLPTLYTQLAEAEESILEAEQQYRAVLDKLGEEQSARHDGLARLEREIDTANKTLVELRRSGTRAKRSKYKTQRESSSFSFQVAALFSSEKSRENRDEIKRLDDEVRRTESESTQTQEQLQTLEEQYDELAAPLRQLQQQIEALSEKRNKGRQAIGKASSDIDDWMSGQLQRLPSDTLRSRLNSLAEMSPAADLFRTCSEELIRATTELQAHISQREENEAQMQQAAATAEQTTNALGESIALGFRVESAERRTNVRLKGSVSFHEEHGVFSGYSGASGSASGAGTGHASYTIDQVQWASMSGFGQCVGAFTQSWSACGERAAHGDMLDSLVAACQRRVADLVRMIRGELERDFSGGTTR